MRAQAAGLLTALGQVLLQVALVIGPFAAQLAHRQQARGRNSEAASSFLLLASASPDGEAARFDYLEQAARAGDLAGLPVYRERLAQERAARSKRA